MTDDHLLARAEPVVLVAVGGFVGANARYAVDLLAPGTLFGTFLVNIIGSFALGLLVYESSMVGDWSDRLRIIAGTGFLSSFTTYSTLITDAVTTEPALAVVYVGASYVVAFVGVLAARWIVAGAERR